MQLTGTAAERALAVARQVEEAFEDVRYPGDHRLVGESCVEALEIADLLRGRHWKDLQSNELVRNYASLFFMTPEAVRFYLAAYLRAVALHYDQSDQLPGALISLLSRPASKDPAEQRRFSARFEPLNKPQREAIKVFLEYLRDEHREDFPTESGVDEPSLLLHWWGGAQQSPP